MGVSGFVRSIAAVAALAVTLLLLPTAAARAFDPNALWKIVDGQCVPNQLEHADPKPCAEVALKDGPDKGYAVLKDRNGPAQFLLIPTQRITGIESPALLAPGGVNYFAAAWQARRFAEKALGHAMPIDTVSLAVNSVLARTQNQLHVHIDCVRADVRKTLLAERAKIGDHWVSLDEPIGGYPYQAMRVMGDTLDGHNPFKLLADGVPGAAADMAHRTLAVVGMMFDGRAPGFVILEDKVDLLHGDFGAGARLQDHACTQDY
jgi:CDP-diacylglycerol pyrophosphatase